MKRIIGYGTAAFAALLLTACAGAPLEVKKPCPRCTRYIGTKVFDARWVCRDSQGTIVGCPNCAVGSAAACVNCVAMK